MPPKSTLGIPAPLPDKVFHKSVDEWLNDKRATDGAEGLWRIHDGLYDFTRFVKMHPGGQFWLEETQGTDITEAFESHHISLIPGSLLRYYYVREARVPRASPFTFEEDGFYKTVKENVREALKVIPKDAIRLSNNFADVLLFGTFMFAILATSFWNYSFGVISGILFAATIIASHNYTHRKDNFRMYYSDICMEDSREWRIIHILSHHLFTNTIADMQAYLAEPLIKFFPEEKSFIVRYGSWIYNPLLLWPTRYFLSSIFKIYNLIFFWRAKNFKTRQVLPFLLPLAMYLLGGQNLLWTIIMWEFVISVGSFSFAAAGFTGSHFHPDIFMDGDKARPEAERDWGINQLDCVSDRREVTGNHFLVLITFGDHALHHLFPTLDHGLLQHLYPVVEETMKQFSLDIRMTTQVDMFTGYFRQIARNKPNPNPPGTKPSELLQ